MHQVSGDVRLQECGEAMPKQLCHPPELLWGSSLLGFSPGASQSICTVGPRGVAQLHPDGKSR